LTASVLETALTVVAVVLALTQPVPQVVRTLRSRSVAGLSGPTTWLGFAVNLAWVVYGVARGLLPVAVLSVAYVAGYLTVGVLLVRAGNRRGIGTAALAGVALGLLAATAGWVVLGTVLALTVAVQFLPQVREAWTADDLAGLSAGTYVVCGLDGLIWGGYGAIVGDRPLLLYGLVMVSVAVAVLVPRQRWARSVAATGAPA
jgi:uncharacterized protein with PQ loop repeat